MFKGRDGGRKCQRVAKTFTAQMLPPPNTKNNPAGLNPNKLEEKVWGWGGGPGNRGRARQERGAKWLGLTHTHPRG